MFRVPYTDLFEALNEAVLRLGLAEERAAMCARLFAETTRDGVYTHGLNRFPGFVSMVRNGYIDVHAVPALVTASGPLERWDGELGPGNLNARHGMELDRSTLAGWVGGACWWLEALHERLARNVFASDHLFADDTPVPVLDPGRGRTKTGRLWVYAREQRAWGGPEPPAAVFLFEPDRKAERRCPCGAR